MPLRLMTGLGIAALLGAAAGVLAPEAAAKDLAPGVTCDHASCTNTTDDTYRVRVRVSCMNFMDTHDMSVWVAPHSTARVGADCDDHWTPGPTQPGPTIMNPDGTWTTGPATTGPDTWQPGFVTGVDYLDATVDNNPRPRSGS